MATVITPERQARGGSLGLSYWLGTKFLSAPLAMESGLAARLQGAIRDKAFDADISLGGLGASKFIGTRAGTGGYRVTDDGIAIIPVQGMLIDRGEWLGDLGGMATTYEGLAEQLRRVLKDEAIKAIVLDIDSGGGMCSGLFDLCGQIEAARRKKPITAVAANMAASAAYAIACTADELYVTQSAVTGSIGVISMHMSAADYLSQAGFEPTIIHAGSHKANGNPYQPLSHLARADMTAQVDAIYADFVAHVAAERGISEDAVRATEAKCYLGDAAVKAKLADGVKTVEQVLEHIRASRAKGGRPRGPAKKASVAASNPRTNGDPGMPGNAASGDTPDYAALAASIVAAIGAVTKPEASATPATPAVATVAVAAPAAAATTAEAAAPAAAKVDERARLKAILGSDAAKTRPGLASHLALETDLDPAAAEAILKVAPAEAATAANPLAVAMRKPGTSANVKPEVASAANGTSATTGLPSLGDRIAAKYPAKSTTSSRRS